MHLFTTPPPPPKKKKNPKFISPAYFSWILQSSQSCNGYAKFGRGRGDKVHYGLCENGEFGIVPGASVSKRGKVRSHWDDSNSSHANKTHRHKKGFALMLVLKVRIFGTRKWAIYYCSVLRCKEPSKINYERTTRQLSIWLTINDCWTVTTDGSKRTNNITSFHSQ